MSLKTERFIYTARNWKTGLTDVKAQIRRNGTQVGTDVALVEIGRGEYELVLTPAMLTTYGGAGYYDVYIDTATALLSAPAVGGKNILVNDSDDLRARSDVIEGKLDSATTKIDTIRSTLLDGTSGTAALRASQDAILSAVQSIQNNTRFVANLNSELIRPASGNNRYRIPMTVYNERGTLEDPDAQVITVRAEDESGNDRTSYLVGYTTGPVQATRLGLGRYRAELDIPSNASQEQIVFFFNYSELGNPIEAQRTTQVLLDVQAAGFALEATAQDIRTRSVDMQPRVANIESVVTNATFGNAALKADLNTIKGYTDSLEGELASGTYGLSAIKGAVDTKASQASLNNAQADLTAIRGVDFDSVNDSLAAISRRTYRGGYAVT